MCGFLLSPDPLVYLHHQEFTDKNYKYFIVTVFSQEGLKTLILMSLKSDRVFLFKSQILSRDALKTHKAGITLASFLSCTHFYTYVPQAVMLLSEQTGWHGRFFHL